MHKCIFERLNLSKKPWHLRVMKTIIKTKRSQFLSTDSPSWPGAEADLVIYSWGDQLLVHIQVMAGEHEREICATQIQAVNAHSQSFCPALGPGFHHWVMYPFVKKAMGHCVWTVYISLCGYLSRDKSVQSHHLSWLALATVAIGAHLVLMGSRETCDLPAVCHHIRHSCFGLR